jgi:hypothetical protein
LFFSSLLLLFPLLLSGVLILMVLLLADLLLGCLSEFDLGLTGMVMVDAVNGLSLVFGRFESELVFERGWEVTTAEVTMEVVVAVVKLGA